VRANEDLQMVKIVAVTNQLTRTEAGALLAKGFDSYISNPADIKDVIRKIEEATAIVY